MAFYRCSGGGSAGTTNIFSAEASQTAFSANTGSRYINVPGKVVNNELIIATKNEGTSILSNCIYQDVYAFYKRPLGHFYCINSNIHDNCKFEIDSSGYAFNSFRNTNFIGSNIDITLCSPIINNCFANANFIGSPINMYIDSSDSFLTDNVFKGATFISSPNIMCNNKTAFNNWFAYSNIRNYGFNNCFEKIIYSARKEDSLSMPFCFKNTKFNYYFNIGINNFKKVNCTYMFNSAYVNNINISFGYIDNLNCYGMFSKHFCEYDDIKGINLYFGSIEPNNCINILNLSYMFEYSQTIYGRKEFLNLFFRSINTIICDYMFKETNIYNISVDIFHSYIISSNYIFQNCRFLNTSAVSDNISKLISNNSVGAFYNANFYSSSTIPALHFDNIIVNANSMFEKSSIFGTIFFNAGVVNVKNIFRDRMPSGGYINVRTPYAYKFNNFEGDSILGMPFVWDVNQNDTKYNSMYKINIINTQ